MSGQIEARLAQLGIELPEPTAPMANYVPFTVAGNLVFVAGQISQWNGQPRHVGKLGAGIGIEKGRDAARLCALNILTHLRTACGCDLDCVRRVVQLRGFVNCTPDFTDMPQSRQRRIGSDGRNFRRPRTPCARGGRRQLAAGWGGGRGRGDFRDWLTGGARR